MARIDLINPSLLDAIEQEERVIAYLTESAYHQSANPTEFDVHRPYDFSINEDEDDQQPLTLTHSASPNGVALGEDAVSTLTTAVLPTPPNPSDANDDSSVESDFSWNKEALRNIINDTIAQGNTSPTRFSNQVFTVDSNPSIAFNYEYGNQPLNGQVPQAEALFSGTVDMVHPTIIRLVEINRPAVTFRSLRATIRTAYDAEAVANFIMAFVNMILKMFITCRNFLCLAGTHGHTAFREALRITHTCMVLLCVLAPTRRKLLLLLHAALFLHLPNVV
jgi:hypothetical protein